jgi:hypothetical protein
VCGKSNAFVHSRRHIDFETPEVVELCRTFYASAPIQGFQQAEARQQFQWAAIRVIQYASRNTFPGGELNQSVVGSFVEYLEDNEEVREKKKGRASAIADSSSSIALPRSPVSLT